MEKKTIFVGAVFSLSVMQSISMELNSKELQMSINKEIEVLVNAVETFDAQDVLLNSRKLQSSQLANNIKQLQYNAENKKFFTEIYNKISQIDKELQSMQKRAQDEIEWSNVAIIFCTGINFASLLYDLSQLENNDELPSYFNVKNAIFMTLIGGSLINALLQKKGKQRINKIYKNFFTWYRDPIFRILNDRIDNDLDAPE